MQERREKKAMRTIKEKSIEDGDEESDEGEEVEVEEEEAKGPAQPGIVFFFFLNLCCLFIFVVSLFLSFFLPLF